MFVQGPCAEENSHGSCRGGKKEESTGRAEKSSTGGHRTIQVSHW